VVDPIRAKLDVLAQWGDFVGPVSELVDALRAVLAILDDPPVPSRMLIPVIREAIFDHLGVTDA
jgi:hypothetical protein